MTTPSPFEALVSTYQQTSLGCPAQYKGKLRDGRWFSLHYDHGTATLGVGTTPEDALRDRVDHVARARYGPPDCGLLDDAAFRDAVLLLAGNHPDLPSTGGPDEPAEQLGRADDQGVKADGPTEVGGSICPLCVLSQTIGVPHVCIVRGGDLDELIREAGEQRARAYRKALNRHPARPLDAAGNLRQVDATWCFCVCNPQNTSADQPTQESPA